MARIFFSYAHEDKEKARNVKAELEKHNHEVWLDEKDIKVGYSIPQAIQIGIKNCDYFAIFLTKNAQESHWVKRELATFLMRDLAENKETLLPLKFDDCIWANFQSNFDSANCETHASKSIPQTHR